MKMQPPLDAETRRRGTRTGNARLAAFILLAFGLPALGWTLDRIDQASYRNLTSVQVGDLSSVTVYESHHYGYAPGPEIVSFDAGRDAKVIAELLAALDGNTEQGYDYRRLHRRPDSLLVLLNQTNGKTMELSVFMSASCGQVDGFQIIRRVGPYATVVLSTRSSEAELHHWLEQTNLAARLGCP